MRSCALDLTIVTVLAYGIRITLRVFFLIESNYTIARVGCQVIGSEKWRGCGV